ncbi:MAG: RCC1 domain-containing protein [Thermomicrobiales bacterium]
MDGSEMGGGADGAADAVARDGAVMDAAGMDAAAMDAAVDAPPSGSANCIRSLSVGERHVCLLKDDGTIWCWGSNGYGPLGDGTEELRHTPTRIGMDTDWKSISAGQNRTCGLKKDGSLWCWGTNLQGEIQKGGPSGVLRPLRIGTANDWAMVDAGKHKHVCGIRGSQIWCWGTENEYGQLGLGNMDVALSPALVMTGGLMGPSVVAPGFQSTCAITTAGALWCWGRGSLGFVGDGTRENRLTPVLANASQGQGGWVSVGRERCGVRGTSGKGQLLCWGFGNPNQVDPTVPTVFGSFNDWTSTDGSCGIRADKTLWCWTYDVQNEITQIGTLSDWTHVSGQSDNHCAVRANRTVWCWGLGVYGMLGITNPPQRAYEPVQAGFSCQ